MREMGLLRYSMRTRKFVEVKESDGEVIPIRRSLFSLENI